MSRVRAWEGRTVVGSDGTPLGTVTSVLFHLTEPRVVGMQIGPPALAYVVARPPRFVVLSDIAPDGDVVRISSAKLPSPAAGERVMQTSWEDTVVWRGMPVVSADGDHLGVVADVSFDLATGAVGRLYISTGAVGDAALGRLEVEGALVRGFDGEAVVVLPGYARIDATGGATKSAAATVAAARVHGERAVINGMRAAGHAAGRVGRSFESGYGRKALDKLKSLMEDDE